MHQMVFLVEDLHKNSMEDGATVLSFYVWMKVSALKEYFLKTLVKSN